MVPGGGPTPLALLLSLASQMTWGEGGKQDLVFILYCGLVELQSMKSHPPLWLPAMISNPSGIRKVLRSRGVGWLSSPFSLSFSLGRSI